MKTRLTVVLAVMLLVLCAVPALAAPKLEIDLAVTYGQIGYNYGEGEQPRGGYPGEGYAFDWALVPSFRIYAEVVPGFGLSLARWYGSGEEYYPYPEAGTMDIAPEGSTSVYSTQFMGEWQLLDLPDGQLSIQGGVRVMAVSQYFLEDYYPASADSKMPPFIPYLGVGVDTNLIGPAIGISGQVRLVDDLWVFGNLSCAALLGKSYHNIPYTGIVASSTFAPQGDIRIGLKYAFSPNLFMAASFNGSALYINPNGECQEIVYAGGPQISLGLQF